VVVSSATITPLPVFLCGIGDIIANDATYQWPHKLFMLSSISDRMDYKYKSTWKRVMTASGSLLVLFITILVCV
jgi:hypothetical protein